MIASWLLQGMNTNEENNCELIAEHLNTSCYRTTSTMNVMNVIVGYTKTILQDQQLVIYKITS